MEIKKAFKLAPFRCSIMTIIGSLYLWFTTRVLYADDTSMTINVIVFIIVSVVLGAAIFPFMLALFDSVYDEYQFKYNEAYRKEVREIRAERVRLLREGIDPDEHDEETVIHIPTKQSAKIPKAVVAGAAGYAAKKGFDVGRKIGKSLV